MTRDLIERGRQEAAEKDAYYESIRRSNFDRARREIRQSFVFRFYEDTLVNDRGCRILGPESPDPEIRLADIAYEELTALGGHQHYHDWTFEWEGITWLANWTWARNWGWELNFYVRRESSFRTRWLRRLRRRSEWVQVFRPASLPEALGK